MALRMHEVSPTQGWPGTLVEITGEGFDPHRDSNLVIVGDRPALVVRASSERLLVMAAEDAQTGEIRVEVGPERADGPAFELLPYPRGARLGRPAAPRFFHGPQTGRPQPTSRTSACSSCPSSRPTFHGHHYRPIGGILAPVRAVPGEVDL